MILAVILIALIPLYGVLFPPLVDLPEHILISKLLWEKVSGVSHLDLEVSFFLAYRLFPAFMLIVISLCKLGGISFVYLPKIVATALLSFHAVVVVTILGSFLKDKSWKGRTFAVCFSLPAVACMYSACWFIGFVNYTLAITLLIPAIFLTERFLRCGKLIDASLLFVSLLLVYMAHPFGPTFWLLWCFSRALAAIASRTMALEWKKSILLGIIVAPIFLYHFFATTGTSLAPSSHSLLGQSPFLSMSDWYHFRLRGLLDGVFLGADNAANSKLFGRAALGLILVSTVLALCSPGNQRARNLTLASVFVIFIASWVNEKFIPIPGGHWLAYDYRFGSTSYVICLAGVGMALIHSLPVSTDRAWYKMIFILLASVSVVASADHLIEVRKAYARFDVPARKYMAKLLNGEKPVGISLPRGRYHPDGTYLNNYVCLTQPDCIAPGTYFSTGHGSELYPVRVRSRRRVVSGPLVGYWKMDEPKRSDACIDSSGNGNTARPTGTTVVEGRINRARSFSGHGDYIDVPTINIPNAITVATWVYSEDFRQTGFVITKNPVNTQWALFFQSGFVKWRGVGTETNVMCPAPSNNNWHHIVARQKGTAGSLFVDGVLCASGNLPAIGNAPSSISIGRFDTIGFDYFVGRIDEVRVYNRALSDHEISELFNGPK